MTDCRQLDHSERAKKAVRLLTMIAAGAVSGMTMYSLWRNQMGVPLELSVPVHMDDPTAPVRPWAPWWVPVSVVAGLTMLLWRWPVLRNRRISLWCAPVVMVLVSILQPFVGIISLEIGAMLQYSPPPSIFKILSVMPLVLTEAAGYSFLMILLGAFHLWPTVAFEGLLIAATGRGALWLLTWRHSVACGVAAGNSLFGQHKS